MMFKRITSSFLKVPKKARTALVASAILPGAGQIYNREVFKGIMLWAMALGFAIWGYSSWLIYTAEYSRMYEHTALADIARVHARAAVPYPALPWVCYGLVVVYSAYDAYLVARQVIELIARERRIRESERKDVLATNGGMP